MNAKRTFGAAACIIALLGLMIWQLESKKITSSGQAVELLQRNYTQYAEYPSESLPPKRIETGFTDNGWAVAFYTEGSGLPGVLAATCYEVSRSGKIEERGTFSAQGNPGPTSIDPRDCAPLFDEELPHFSAAVVEKVKSETSDYERKGLAGNVDGFLLVQAYPKLIPADFQGVQAVGGNYFSDNGQLFYTGNAASNSPGITLEGMRILLKNISHRLGISIDSNADVDDLLRRLGE